MKPGKYKHFKGGEYEVLFVGKHSETLEDMVIYRPLYGEGGIWVRPLEMFLGTKTLEDGTVVQRFKKVD